MSVSTDCIPLTLGSVFVSSASKVQASSLTGSMDGSHQKGRETFVAAPLVSYEGEVHGGWFACLNSKGLLLALLSIALAELVEEARGAGIAEEMTEVAFSKTNKHQNKTKKPTTHLHPNPLRNHKTHPALSVNGYPESRVLPLWNCWGAVLW